MDQKMLHEIRTYTQKFTNNPNEKFLLPVLLGFSFGEWSAAAAAGCMSKEEGFLIATMRGIYTSQAGGSSLLVTARELFP